MHLLPTIAWLDTAVCQRRVVAVATDARYPLCESGSLLWRYAYRACVLSTEHTHTHTEQSNANQENGAYYARERRRWLCVRTPAGQYLSIYARCRLRVCMCACLERPGNRSERHTADTLHKSIQLLHALASTATRRYCTKSTRARGPIDFARAKLARIWADRNSTLQPTRNTRRVHSRSALRTTEIYALAQQRMHLHEFVRAFRTIQTRKMFDHRRLHTYGVNSRVSASERSNPKNGIGRICVHSGSPVVPSLLLALASL